MSRFKYAAAVAAVLAIVVFLALSQRPAQVANAGMMSASASPVSGYTLHIDASQHFANHPDEIIHHWCKTFSPSFIECQLYDADGPNGHMIGVETIVPTSVWKTYSADERAKWHYHRVVARDVRQGLDPLGSAGDRR